MPKKTTAASQNNPTQNNATDSAVTQITAEQLVTEKYSVEQSNTPIIHSCDAGGEGLKKETEFFQACAKGQIAKVTEALNKDVTLLNARSRHGIFPEMFAALNGHWDIMQLFYTRGVDVNRKAAKNYNALYMLAYGNHYNLVEKLMSLGATGFDEEQQDDPTDAPTPFYIVSMSRDHLPLAEKMMDKGAKGFDVTVKTGKGVGLTPFWILEKHARLLQRWKLIEKMMGKGARSFDATPSPLWEENPNQGITPFWDVAFNAQWDLVRIMRILGAKNFEAKPISSKHYNFRNEQNAKTMQAGGKDLETLRKIAGSVFVSDNVPETGETVQYILETGRQWGILNLISDITKMNPEEYYNLYTETLISLLGQETPYEQDDGLLWYILRGCRTKKPANNNTLDSKAQKDISLFLKKILADAVKDFQPIPFQLTLKLTKIRFNSSLTEHPVLKESFEISITSEEHQSLLQLLVDKAKEGPNVKFETTFLNFLQNTQAFKKQCLRKRILAEQKVREEHRQQCQKFYSVFMMVPEQFRELADSKSKQLLKESTEKYHKVLDLIGQNKKALEAQQPINAIPSGKKPSADERNRKSALRSFGDRTIAADTYYRNIKELFEGGKDKPCNLKDERAAFFANYETASQNMSTALKAEDLTKLQTFTAPLQARHKTFENLIQQLKTNINGLDQLISVLETQSCELSLQKQHVEEAQKAEDEKSRKENMDKQDALLKQIEEDMAKQQALEAQEQRKHQRSLERDQHKAKAREIHRLKLVQQSQEKKLRDEQNEKEANDNDHNSVNRRDKHAPSFTNTLAAQVMPQIKTQENNILTKGYFNSFEQMIADEISLETEPELEGYALLGKLAQLLEMMKKRNDMVGFVAREVRNTLYHADPRSDLFNFSGASQDLKDSVHMILELSRIDWKDSKAVEKATLPFYFVKLALYPREAYKNTKEELGNYTFKSLQAYIQKLDSEKTSANNTKSNNEKDTKNRAELKIEIPTPALCEEHFKLYEERVTAIRARFSKDKTKPIAVVNAIGYLEGLMGSYVKDASNDKSYQGFLKEEQYREVQKRGKAFRHNYQDLNSLVDVDSDDEENGMQYSDSSSGAAYDNKDDKRDTRFANKHDNKHDSKYDTKHDHHNSQTHHFMTATGVGVVTTSASIAMSFATSASAFPVSKPTKANAASASSPSTTATSASFSSTTGLLPGYANSAAPKVVELSHSTAAASNNSNNTRKKKGRRK